MKYCECCKMKVNTEKSYCPLCGDQLLALDDSEVIEFPVAQGHLGNTRRAFLSRLFFFLSLFVVAICVIVNIATYEIAPIKWSVVAGLGVFYCWHVIKRCIFRRGNATKILLYQLIIISAMLIAIDVFLGTLDGWSICYAIPFLSISISITTMIIALANSLYFRNYLHYSMGIILFGVLQAVGLFFVKTWWAIASSIAVSLCVFIVLLLVSKKSVTGEIKKRLHI